ncbi:MAG TPA: MBL fold metallo-hydrolase [Pyrinomonadaceae bacterium]|jgi:glyoxylase-like metal-dependent hydrolase (beta-lactamase superfamily II)
MKRLALFLAVLLLVCLSTTYSRSVQQQDFSKVEIKSTLAAGNIHMLEGAGGNIAVSVGRDGALMVDDQFLPLADKIRAELKKLGEGKLKYVLNTHWHGDHTGGNQAFGQEATIVAQENVRRRLAAGQMLLGDKIPPARQEALPVITYNASMNFYFNGEEVHVVHYPHGHTDGDSVIFFTGSNVAHLGDDFFAGRFPFVDLESGGSVEGLTKNIAEIIRVLPAGVKIIPGHGPLSTIEDLRLYHRMLVETTNIVRKGMAAGKSLEQIKKEGLPEEWKTWGTGFIKTEQWIETIYRSFSTGAGKGAKNHSHSHASGSYIYHGH